MYTKLKIIIVMLLMSVVIFNASKSYATIYFNYDAESCTVGAYLPNPPWRPCCSTPEQSRGYCVADNTMQGNNIVQWNVPQGLDHQINYTSLTTQPAAPFGTYYYAFFFRFDRINGIDIWREGDFSYFDKAAEIDGDGVRWVIQFGERGMLNQDHNFSVFITNPTYHLNPALEISDSYFQNYGGYSRTNSIQLGYEKWHSLVFAMKWATDNTGEISLWINGIKVLQYLNIRTAQAPGTITELGWNGTYAQPAYDIPAHYRKLDAIIFTDNWQDIIDGGYLKKRPLSPYQNPPQPQ